MLQRLVASGSFAKSRQLRQAVKSRGRTPVAVAKPQVLVLTGPTAVGKTQLSLSLAERLGGEIISADSVQVYKGLDVGSDKARVC